MNKKTRIVLLLGLAAIVLVWGLGMSDDKDGGYSDETTYYSVEELEERQRVIDEMAKMRGETPKPTATAEPEEKDLLEELFPDVAMQELAQSFTLTRAGYGEKQQILLAEFNMTGLIYAYYDVPQEEWDRLMAAESFDKWFEAMIMSKYKFEQLN